MKVIRLNSEQQKLVESNLTVVPWAIRETLQVNSHVCGLEYDDLYQEGCIWLCRAALSYDSSRSQFSTYAKAVVRNGLISHYRQVSRYQKHISRLPVEEQGETAAGSVPQNDPDEFLRHLSDTETSELLKSRLPDYHGVARLGIEALELKVKGMTITEIARLYGVPPSHVGAWISRSVKKLQKDREFLSAIL